jgi:hypothetical protein
MDYSFYESKPRSRTALSGSPRREFGSGAIPRTPREWVGPALFLLFIGLTFCILCALMIHQAAQMPLAE